MPKSTKIIFGVEVDISDYYDENQQPKIPPPPQHLGTFSHFGWYNISRYKGRLYCDELSNLGIRVTQDVEREQDDFDAHLSREGWSTIFFPPIVSLQTDLPKNGRKRIRGGVNSGEKWIVAAFYNYPDITSVPKQKRQTITNGIQANISFDKSDPSTFADFYNGAVVLSEIDSEFDPQDSTCVNNWLHKEIDIESALGPISIGRLKKKIATIGAGGSAFMHMMDRTEAESYCLKSSKIISHGGIGGEDDTSKVAMFVPNQVNAYRFFGKHVLQNAKLGKKSYVVLYTSKPDADICTDAIKNFRTLMNQLTQNSAGLVMSEMGAFGENYDCSKFTSSMWEILGCIPQKKLGQNAEEHKTLYNVNDLIKIDNY